MIEIDINEVNSLNVLYSILGHIDGTLLGAHVKKQEYIELQKQIDLEIEQLEEKRLEIENSILVLTKQKEETNELRINSSPRDNSFFRNPAYESEQ